jgi:hypothetical protein
MSDQSEDKQTKLRTMVAAMELAMADVESTPAKDAWKTLVGGLDLGPEPKRRACPTCGKLGMANASRCGFCWNATPVVAS